MRWAAWIIFANLCIPDIALAQPALRLEPLAIRMSSGASLSVELGTFQTAENRRNPHSRKIDIAFVRLRTTAPHPGNPIVYLAGGPGSSGISDLQGPRGPMFERLRAVADVIVLDQRGTGRSNAIPPCQPADGLDPGNLTESAIIAYMRRQFSLCLARWRAAGVDPDGYNLLESARDIEDLRVRLGAPRLDLVGISYGPQLGMAYMRLFPGHVGHVVFASGRGLDQTVRLPSQIDAYLRRLGGRNLVGLMRRVHRRLDARPATVSFVPPGATEAVSMRFDSFPVRYAISFFLLNDAQGAQSLPALYARMDRGDFTAIARLIHAQCLDPRRGRFTAFRGMGELMDLSSNWSDTRRRRWQREVGASALGDAHNYPIPQGLGPWPDLDIPLALKMPLRSDAPALFLSGTHDGRVPLEAQAETMAGFRHGRQIIVEGGGHNLFEQAEAIQAAVARFLQDGSIAAPRITLAGPGGA